MIEKVAITGGIAEGKSTVLRILNEFGEPTFSSDEYVKKLYLDPFIIDLLQKKVGCNPFHEKEKFREMFFNDSYFRESVESIIHPLIRNGIKESSAYYIEVPLLFEKGLDTAFKKIWVVTCGQKIQWKRLIKRIKDPELALKILKIQWPSKQKILYANHVIWTNRPIYQIRKEVKSLLSI